MEPKKEYLFKIEDIHSDEVTFFASSHEGKVLLSFIHNGVSVRHFMASNGLY